MLYRMGTVSLTAQPQIYPWYIHTRIVKLNEICRVLEILRYLKLHEMIYPSYIHTCIVLLIRIHHVLKMFKYLRLYLRKSN